MISFRAASVEHEARLIKMEFDLSGKRHRIQWREAAKFMKQEPFEDWVVGGPRTTGWCIKFIDRRGGGALDHHR
eukprot:426273-Karenia_brevis.AAC.1